MLTIITGAPGAGKGAAGLELVLDTVKLRDEGGKEVGRRPLYVVEVPNPNMHPLGLKVPHVLLDGERGRQWHEVVPDGAVIYVPEAQDIWGPRGPSVKPGPDVLELARHRHRGIDVIVDTQHPRQLDNAVKALCGRHIHIRDTGWLGRWWYEWPELSETIAWKTCVQKRKWKLPKHVFQLYTSASMHVKPIRGVPPALYFAIAMLVLLAVLVTVFVRSLASKGEPKDGKPIAHAQGSNEGSQAQPIRTSRVQNATAVSLLEEAVPRLSVRPETAPMYDHLRQVVTMPRIVGGYCQGKRCRCYTQQFTDPGIGEEACRDWLRSPPFDPYRPEVVAREERPKPATGAASAPPANLL